MIRIKGTETNGHITFDETFEDFEEAFNALNEKGFLKNDALEISIIEKEEGYSSEIDEKYNITTDGIGNIDIFEEEYDYYIADDEDYRNAIENHHKSYEIYINDDYPDIDLILENQDIRMRRNEKRYDYNLYYFENKEEVQSYFENMDCLDIAEEDDDIKFTYDDVSNWEYPLLLAEPNGEQSIYTYSINEDTGYHSELELFLENLESHGEFHSIQFTRK